jgi:hypothetical protein
MTAIARRCEVISESDQNRIVAQRFYFYALVCAALVVFAGFTRSYFLKGLFGTPALYPLLHVHGLVMTSWFVLFGVQTLLIQGHRTDVHRRLGVAGVLLAATMVAVGSAVVIINARGGRVPPGAPIPVIMILSFGNLAVFGALVGAAIYFRGRREFHKRLMLLATLSLLPAAIQRMPLDFMGLGVLPTVFGLTDVFIFVCVAYDTWRHRRLHPAFAVGAILIIAWVPLAIALGGSSAWGHLTTWLIGSVKMTS